jgi:hypothetical protein
MNRHSLPAIAAVLLGLACGAAEATPLALTTGLSVSMASGTTGLLTLSATNLVGGTGDITTFNGFGLALQLIPQAGASGTVQFANFFVPATNGILPDPDVPQFELNGITNMSPVNGSSVATSVALLMSETAPSPETTVPQGVLKNLGTLQFISTSNAVGTWTLYAVNDAFGRSYWTNAVADETTFDQLAATNGTALTLGTVSIVPEPSIVVFAVGAAMMLAASRHRHARNRR